MNVRESYSCALEQGTLVVVCFLKLCVFPNQNQRGARKNFTSYTSVQCPRLGASEQIIQTYGTPTKSEDNFRTLTLYVWHSAVRWLLAIFQVAA